MNLRHTAAVALVGWYLVYPYPRPVSCPGVYCDQNPFRDFNYYPEIPVYPGPSTLRQELIDQREQLLVELSGMSGIGPNDPKRKAVEAQILTLSKKLFELDRPASLAPPLLDSAEPNRPTEWSKLMRFDTERDCETERATHGVSARCMASDDPRLKEKEK